MLFSRHKEFTDVMKKVVYKTYVSGLERDIVGGVLPCFCTFCAHVYYEVVASAGAFRLW